MATFALDTYVLYAPSMEDRTHRPPWPAVVCHDKDVPQRMLNDRPRTFNIPVLLLQKLQFKWASPGDLLVLEDLQPPEDSGRWAGLTLAYGEVCLAYQHGLGYSHWLAVRRANNELHGIEEVYAVDQKLNLLSDESDEDDDDAELAMAIKASLEDNSGDRTAVTAAIPSRSRSDNEEPTLRTSKTNESLKRARSRSLPCAQPGSSRIPALPSPSASMDSHLGTLERDSVDEQLVSAAPSRERTTKRRRYRRNVTEDLSRKEYNNAADEAVDGEASMEEDENEGLVCFTVGRDANESKYLIPEENVRDKTYFVAPHLSFLQPVGKNLRSYVFVRPCLRDIDPEDFKHIADYLSTDDFGHRVIEDWEQRAESVEECYKAWKIAQELGMWDLMAKIVEKIQRAQPWETEEVFAFSKLVYDSAAVLPDHDDMKDLFSKHIAEEYWNLVDEHTTTFAELIKTCPELELDVIERRRETLRTTIDMVQDGSDEEETEEQ